MSPLRSRLQFPPATLSLPSASRSFSRTAVVRARAAPDSSSSSSSSSDLSPAENARKRQSDSPLRRGNLGGAQVKEPNFRKWRDTKALQWKNTKRNETNWLGRETPFPQNPSFRPPPPLPDELRDDIYAAFVRNAAVNSVRALSAKHGISLKRIEAIIRLKALERSWKEGQPLQTAFQEAMESALGVNAESARRRGVNVRSGTRVDATAADYSAEQSEEDKRSNAGVSRVYWEMVDEGKDPIVPPLLDSQAKASMKGPEIARLSEHSIHGNDSGRTKITFVDVGMKFAHSNPKAKLHKRT